MLDSSLRLPAGRRAQNDRKGDIMEEEIKFEKALERLEKIVEELESGDLALEEALKRYEEGVKLSRACTKKLTEAEKKIETLTRTLNDVAVSQSENSEDSALKKSAKAKSKKITKESDASSDADFLL